MEKFLEKSRPDHDLWARAAATAQAPSAQYKEKMAPTETTDNGILSTAHNTPTTTALKHMETDDYTQIAAAAAQML